MKMVKRMVAFVLCFLLISSGPLSAFATNASGEDAAVVNTTAPEEAVEVCEECGSSDVHTETCSLNTTNTLNTEAPDGTTTDTEPEETTVPTTVATEPEGDEEDTDETTPACTCGAAEGEAHKEGCALYVNVEICEYCGVELTQDAKHARGCALSDEDDEDCYDDYVDDDFEDNDGESDGEFKTPVDYTSVAELPKLIESTVQSTMYSLRTMLLSDDDADDEVEDDTGDEEENEGEEVTHHDHPNIITEKSVIYSEEGGYKLRLESYLTGEPTITTNERVPSDIVVVIDQSGSMDYCFYCGDDNADSLYKVFTGLDLTKTYYVKATSDATKGTPVYYCDGTSCKNSHTAGWYTEKHTSNSSGGARYVHSIGNRYKNESLDGKVFRPRVFYTDSALTTNANQTIKKAGEYWVSISSVLTRVYYCETCRAWFTTETCNATNHTRGNSYLPRCSAEDAGYRTKVFYERIFKHEVTAATLNSDLKYYVKTNDIASGDTYTPVYQITANTWNTKKKGSGTTYTFGKTTIYYQCPISRVQALKNALNGFLTDIYADSAGEDGTLGTADDVENRIAIVGFGARDEETTAGPPTNAVLSYSTDGKTAQTIGYNSLKKKIYQKSMWAVNTTGGQSIINGAVSSLQTETNTEVYRGIEMANNIFYYNTSSEKRNKILVVFTDGYPTSPNTDQNGNTGSFSFTDEAIDYARTAKDKYGATVYTIGVFSGADASNMVNTCQYTGTTKSILANKFMHLVSSNYLDPTKNGSVSNHYMATAYSSSDVNPDLKTGSSYYLSASTTSALNEIFKAIAQSVKGGGAYITSLDETTEITDTVSNEFTIPDDGRTITAHTEAFTGEISGVMSWSNDNNSAIDSGLSISTDGNKVTVNGFSFTEYYVATDIDSDNNEVPRGRKLVIEIPIEPADANLGGTYQETNVSNAGIYLNGDCYENFDMPHVDIPTAVSVSVAVVGGERNSFDLDLSYTGVVHNETTISYDGNNGSTGNYLDANTESVTKSDENYTAQSVAEETSADALMNSLNFTGYEYVYVGNKLTLTEKNVSNYLVQYSVNGADWIDMPQTDGNASVELDVTPGMKILVRNILCVVDLNITKNIYNFDSNDIVDQSFLFEIEKVGAAGNTKLMTVVIPAQKLEDGTETITIRGLEVGEYKVTELTDWSWRYDVVDKDGNTENVSAFQTVILSSDGGSVTFYNKRTDDKWLSGDCYAENWWGTNKNN